MAAFGIICSSNYQAKSRAVADGSAGKKTRDLLQRRGVDGAPGEPVYMGDHAVPTAIARTSASSHVP